MRLVEFANGLNTRMPVAEIPWESPTAWEDVISRTQSGSAPGSDGWRYQELKILPVRLDLAVLCGSGA